jgi:hypothetical protein
VISPYAWRCGLAAVVFGAHVLFSLVVFSSQLEAAPFALAVATAAWALAAHAALLLVVATRGSGVPP